MISKIPDKQHQIANRYDMSMGAVGQQCRVGQEYDYFLSNTKNLPTSEYSLYLLTTLPVEERDKLLTEHPKSIHPDRSGSA